VLPRVYAFFILNIVAFWRAFSASPDRPGMLAGSAFFIWASVYNLFIVSLFWSMTSELYASEQGKRLFAFIAAGGTAGALVGPLLPRVLVAYIPANDLLLVSAALLGLALGLSLDLRRSFASQPAAGSRGHDSEPAGQGGILAGAQRVLTSPYLRLIALYVLFANLIGTYFYLEQLRIVGEAIPDRTARIEFFATRDHVTSWITLALQVFVTARVMQRFGVGLTLAVLPVVAAAGLVAISYAPSLEVVAAVLVADRAIAFALSNPASKVLYTVVTPDEKYKAQNFIDTVVYRGGDAASGWVFNSGAKALGLAGGAVALLTLPAAALWLATAYVLGRQYAARAAAQPANDPDRQASA
jgi:AAA family ATP:ADP antiporter